MKRTDLRLKYQKETGYSWTEVNAQPTIGYTRWLEGVIMMMEMNQANGVNKSTEPALHKHIVSNSLLPCGFDKCLVDIEGEKMCSFCKYNSNNC